MATKRTPQQQTYYNAELARERQGWSAAAGQVSQQQKNYDAEIARERQGFADAYSALHPTWVPDAADNVTLSHPITPLVFDPMLDPTYAAAYSGVQNANQHAQANYDYQGHSIGQQYGYDSGGGLISSGADLNPYAVAAVMKRNYDNSVRGTNNSYAAQGQLYSGALKNAQASNDYNYGLQSDQTQRAAQNAYHNSQLSLQGTQDAGSAQLAALIGPALASFLANQKGY
jgi:hypothetical protein